MNTQSIIFGMDGWRAVMDVLFTDTNVVRVAHAFARSRDRFGAAGSQTIAIAYDGRRNSRHYAGIFAEVISSYGHPVLFSDGIVPTPVLSYAVKHRACAAGVMITAGADPPQYNGITFNAAHGGLFMSGETATIEECIPPDAEPYAPRPAIIQRCDFLPEYLAHLKTLVNFETLKSFAAASGGHAAVMIDSMGGAGQTLLEDLLGECGWRAQTLFGSPDEQFYGRSPDPAPQNLEPLRYNVGVTDALLGIATDGDAGRCSVMYDDGEWVNAQEAILVLVKHLHEQKHWTGGVVKPASVTDKLRLLADGWDAPVYDTFVGFRDIAGVMLTKDCMFGGEINGEFGYKGHVPDRDGILTGLFFAEMIAQSGNSLRTLIGEIRAQAGQVHTGQIDARCDMSDRSDLLHRFVKSAPAELAGFPVKEIKQYEEFGTLTGVKLQCGDCRWLLLRPSLTEALVHVYAEGQADEEVEAFLAAGAAVAGM
jgi:phosphomannomutase